MKRSFRYLISYLLVAIFLFQPFMPEIAARAQDDLNYREGITGAQAEFDKTYNDIMAIEEVSLSDFSKFVLNGAGFFADLFNGKEPNPEYNAKIDEANEQIRSAKAKATEIKAQMSGDALGAKDIDNKVYEMKNGFAASAAEVESQQNALIEAGETLQGVAHMLDGLGIIISAVSILLVALGITSAIGAVLEVAGIAITAASNTLGALGDSLIAAGESGKMDDRSMSDEYRANLGKAALSTGLDVAMSIGPGKILKAYGASAVTANAVDDFAKFNILDDALEGTKIASALGEVKPSDMYGLAADCLSFAGGPDISVISGTSVIKKSIKTAGNGVIDSMRETPGLE